MNENGTQGAEPACTRFGNLGYMHNRPRTAVHGRLSAVTYEGIGNVN